ncbi:uncharacterized protein LOC111473706 [Cucurbita maxima]|uniref:Uncharacterized protein LOC111473706 n=1 Tax=Cucurbita maxima TaxID=3661 RepID=A0A6J1IHQ3_CUCMA|nr:uncharacterized protein LOC111473706 [Cucurbita maxima]
MATSKIQNLPSENLAYNGWFCNLVNTIRVDKDINYEYNYKCVKKVLEYGVNTNLVAVSVKIMSPTVLTLGVISFIYGVVAENKKPASRTPIPGKGTVICQYPADPTVALGYLSVGFLLASSIAGYLSLFYPYQGKPVPRGSMFKSSTSSIFFNIALFTTGLTITLLVWPTITEKIHLTRNVHQNLETACLTAKTGLLGGGAFLSLDSSLFWLVALMWAGNAREDYFDEIEENGNSVEALKNSA